MLAAWKVPDPIAQSSDEVGPVGRAERLIPLPSLALDSAAITFIVAFCSGDTSVR